jgi:E3 ubiquitin-protein ligase CHFR
MCERLRLISLWRRDEISDLEIERDVYSIGRLNQDININDIRLSQKHCEV